MSNDWMPRPCMEILAMCRKWLSYITPALLTAWGIPQEQFAELGTLFAHAEALLQKAMDEAERTHVITVQCQAAFAALIAKMRFFRDRYFKMPPLTEGDWAALGFRQKVHPSPVPAPEGVPAATLSYPGAPHLLFVHLGPMAGTRELDPASDYGYALYVGIMPPGGATLEQAASDKHYLMKTPADGKGLHSTTGSPGDGRRSCCLMQRTEADRMGVLPLREPERRGGAVGPGGFRNYTVGAEVKGNRG